ncbi:MAG: NUDIX domain-containing protein [Alphaproteobacteria bacterium]|nr:NUDIX domain-containing protein [Alphaproteobacteria bacterium]
MKLRGTIAKGLARAVAKGFTHVDARGRPVQAAAMPWRRRGDGDIEILLVTGRRGRRWIVPKGWPMRGRSLAEAAAQEAWEEAGVRGRVAPRPIGRFRHHKRHRLLGPTEFIVLLFPLEVESEAQSWPERDQRARRWCRRRDAAEAVASPALAKLVRGFSP